MRKKMTKKKSTILFLICIVFVGILAFTCAEGLTLGNYRVKPFSETINKGLDIQGGISVLEQVQGGKVDINTLNRTIELISMRVNKMGVSETSVTKQDNDKIEIDIPGKFDSKEILDTVAKSGILKFVGPDKKTILTGKDVQDASADIGDDNKPEISLSFNSEGTKKFAAATQKFIGQPIAIYMDADELTNPTVQAVISDGKAVITGSTTLAQATSQAEIIKSGALPVALKAVSVQTVGATLGESALSQCIEAGAIGTLFILIFMASMYKVPGLIADVSLILYVILVLCAFTVMNVTLTIAGIAGFLLTIGMAVDANVLIFERTREELKTGKSIRSSVHAGYRRALPSIIDSNTTTMVAGLVLYSMGSGSVKGFALTLIIGIIISICITLIWTKFLLKLAIEMGLLSKLSHFGVKKV